MFTTNPVSDNDIDLIVKCGMKAPSGMNRQPWRFKNMYVAAQGLGLGAHIYARPVGNINTKLGIPDDYQAVTVLRVGSIDKSVDAVSAASTRKKPEEVVNYK